MGDSRKRKIEEGDYDDDSKNDKSLLIIKANVTEADGEISCSVEETNRIRALLGLKPLNEEKPSDEAAAVKNFHDKKEKEQQLKEQTEIKERLEKAKEERLLRKNLTGKSLGLALDVEDSNLLNAADWVNRSRSKPVTNNSIKQANTSSEKDSSTSLKGLKVMHSEADFDMGKEVILTLADSNILETDEHGKLLGISNGEDVLENINLTENEKRLERERQKKRLRQAVYTAYDDAEFADNGMGAGVRPSILPQYDVQKKSGPRLVLSGEGDAMDIGHSSVVADDERDKKPVVQSLKIETKTVSDFYSASEYASFAKSKGGKGNKKRKIRKKEDDDDVNDQGEKGDVTDSNHLLAVLEASAEAEEASSSATLRAHSSNHGSRAKRVPVGASADQAAAEAIHKREEYALAVKAANQKAQAHMAFQKQQSQGGAVRSAIDDDDAEIRLSLEQARRVALQAQAKTRASEAAGTYADLGVVVKSEPNDDDPGAEIARRLLAKQPSTRSSSQPSVKTEMDVDGTQASASVPRGRHLGQGGDINNSEELRFDEIDGEGRRSDGTLVFTSTTEFSTRLQARLNERARSRAEAAVKAVSASATSAVAGSAHMKTVDTATTAAEEDVTAAMDVDDGHDDDDDEVYSDDDDPNKIEGSVEDEELAFVRQQPLVTKGMAATLALLKSTGDLKKASELAGRAKDSRTIDPSSEDFGVKLEYRDEFGRKLTQKEAFRQLCYRFHGYGAGKKKSEKRLKAMEQQSKAASSRVLDTGGSMKSLVRAQEATGKAHITIQGGVGDSNNRASVAAAVLAKTKKSSSSSSSSQHGKQSSSSVKSGASGSVVRSSGGGFIPIN